ncbi:MAG: DNA polymerase III subunit delta [Candidatus Aminicenantes bacterium]|nr:DNA polymerase III subunit delta [Candidatus Aminicenantes bacterium]
MAGPSRAGGLREESLLAGYLFYGEEEFLAEEFIGELKGILASSAGDEFRLTRMDLDETKWREVIDTARTAPFLFESWRAIVVRVPERRSVPDKGQDGKGDAGGEEGKGAKFLSVIDQKILRDYFASPPSRTVLVVLRAGRVRKDDAVVRFFQSLPKGVFAVVEMKPLSAVALMKRAEEKANALGKTLTERAKKRLFEVLGQDLRLTLNEVEKLAVYVGDKKGIEEDDVNQATAWQRSFKAYELDDALAAADFAKQAAILNDLLAEGERPEQIVGRLAGFFRNVLAAQTWLRERSRTNEEIFHEFFPYISKNFGDLYRRKSADFFDVVEGLSPADLSALLGKLRKVDILLKTTEAVPKRALEIFLSEYCLARKKRTIISPERI